MFRLSIALLFLVTICSSSFSQEFHNEQIKKMYNAAGWIQGKRDGKFHKLGSCVFFKVKDEESCSYTFGLTCYHVISSYQPENITFHNYKGEEVLVSKCKPMFASSVIDYAIAYLPDAANWDIPEFKIQTESPKIGQPIHSVGLPLGRDILYAKGYIAGLNKDSMYNWKRHSIDMTTYCGCSGSAVYSDSGEFLGLRQSVLVTKQLPLLENNRKIQIASQRLCFITKIKDIESSIGEYRFLFTKQVRKAKILELINK